MEDNKRYRVRRTEFGHGQSGNMNPGRMESYGSTSHRGFGARPDTGRDYEQNVGYRENYDSLDNGQRQRNQRRNGIRMKMVCTGEKGPGLTDEPMIAFSRTSMTGYATIPISMLPMLR